MNNKKLFYVIISFIFLSLAGCKSGEKHNISLRLNKGDHFVQNMKMDMKMNMEVMGQKMDMNMLMDGAFAFDVMDSSAEGKKLKLTYQKMTMRTKMEGPAGAAGQATSDSIMDMQSKLVTGKSIFLTIDKNYTITNVEGMQAMMDSTQINEQTKQMMEKMFTKEQMNSMFGMMFSMYPKTPVAIGDKWTSNMDVDVAGIAMTVKYTYTLTDIKNDLAYIKLDGVIDGKGKMKNLPMEITDMKGSQNGTLTLAMNSGYIQKGNYKMDIKADMEMMGQKMPMKMSGDYELSGE